MEIHKVIDGRVPLEISEDSNSPIFHFLLSKTLIGRERRTRGRYADYTLQEINGRWEATRKGNPVESIPVYQTDIWMSDSRIESTIGVPTPANAGEVLELCHQLQLVDRRKNTITDAGLLFKKLRQASPALKNPFILGIEAIVLLRQIIATDGLMISSIAKEAVNRSQFSRDELAIMFPDIVKNALESGRQFISSSILKKGTDFLKIN